MISRQTSRQASRQTRSDGWTLTAAASAHRVQDRVLSSTVATRVLPPSLPSFLSFAFGIRILFMVVFAFAFVPTLVVCPPGECSMNAGLTEKDHISFLRVDLAHSLGVLIEGTD